MKRKTYNNVLKAGKLIEKKGYDEKTALDIAVQCFDNMEAAHNGMPVEWFINQIVDRKQYEEENKR